MLALRCFWLSKSWIWITQPPSDKKTARSLWFEWPKMWSNFHQNGKQKLYTPLNGWSFPCLFLLGTGPFSGAISFFYGVEVLQVSVSFFFAPFTLAKVGGRLLLCHHPAKTTHQNGVPSGLSLPVDSALVRQLDAKDAPCGLKDDWWLTTHGFLLIYGWSILVFRHPSLPLIFFLREIGPPQFNTNRNRISYDASPQS